MKYIFVMVITIISSIDAQPLPLSNLGNTCYMNSVLQNILNMQTLNVTLLGMITPPAGTLIPSYLDLVKDYNKGSIQNNHLQDFYKSVDSIMVRDFFISWIHNIAEIKLMDKDVIEEQLLIKMNELTAETFRAQARADQKKDKVSIDYYNNVKDKNDALINFLQKEFQDLQKTKDFTDYFLNFEKRFLGEVKLSYRQEDAAQFYLGFMDTLYDPAQISQQNLQALAPILKWEQIITRTSQKYGDSSKKNETMYLLSLPIKGSNITACLDDYFTSHDLDFAIKINGVQRNDVVEEIRLGEPKEFLTIQLKRFDYDLNKINDQIAVPENLNIYNYVHDSWSKKYSKNDQMVNYVLIGVVMHHGNSIAGGHYTTYVKSIIDGIWYLCNDSTITPIGKNLISENGYNETRDGYLVTYMQKFLFDWCVKNNIQRHTPAKVIDSFAQGLTSIAGVA